jgi:hypothetical protein
MRRTLRLTCHEIRPEGLAILRRMDASGRESAAPRLNDLALEARALLEEVAEPAAVFQQVGFQEFSAIYRGAGANDPSSPLEAIVRHSRGLAVFAATLGPHVDAAVRERFSRGDASEARMLDAFTSAACERLALVTADQFAVALGSVAPALPYSPGYCGWHVTGLAAVFDRLHPDEIGASLRGSILQPLNSVAGIIVAAPAAAHRIDTRFACCVACSRWCLDRHAALPAMA